MYSKGGGIAIMRKNELISTIASLTGREKKVVREVLNTFVDVVRQFVRQGEKVRIAGLGTFAAVDRPARRYKNPITGGDVMVPPGKRVKFSPSADFKSYVNNA